MKNIAIVTDSAADIPEELAKACDITVIPFNFGFEGEFYKDGKEVNSNIVFDKLREGIKVYTSAPSVGEFIKTYYDLIKNKKKDLIYSIHVSSGLSTIVNSALQAKKNFPEAEIKVIDSKTAAIGMGIMALEAARAVKEGESEEKIDKILDYLIRNNKLFATFENFKYLFVGGRAPFLGKFLSMSIRFKPIITIGSDGKIKLVKFVKSQKNSLIELYWQVKKTSYPNKKKKIGIVYGEDIGPALELEKIIRSDSEIEIDELILTEITKVMSAHTGPGIWGIAVCPTVK